MRPLNRFEMFASAFFWVPDEQVPSVVYLKVKTCHSEEMFELPSRCTVQLFDGSVNTL